MRAASPQLFASFSEALTFNGAEWGKVEGGERFMLQGDALG